MAGALREAGARVEVFRLVGGERLELQLRREGIPVHDCGRSSLPPIRLIRLVARMSGFAPHVIQSVHTYTNAYATLAGQALGALSVGALRSSVAHSRAANGAWTGWLLRGPAALVVNSRSAFDDLESSGVRAEGSTYLLPNAVAPAALRRRRPGKTGVDVVFLGRLVPVKRVDLFLHAIARARSRDAGVRGLVAGDGPGRDAAEKLARELDLAPPRVVFLGAIESTDAVLAEADLLIQCSDDEGSPNAILEAMAAGLAVVATPAGDTPGLLEDGRSGLVVPFGDAEALADRILALARSAPDRERLGEQARIRSAAWGPETLAPRLLEIYRDAAVRRGHRRLREALG
jgi:glycosyltransferase involved in cell wall biosynthesis